MPHCYTPIHGCLNKDSRVTTSALNIGTCTSVIKSHPKTNYLTNQNDYKVPAYCYHCGKPFPWTEALLQEADRIIDMADVLTSEQKSKLKETFPNLIAETQKTISSALTAGNILSKLKPGALVIDALKSATKEHLVPAALKFLRW